MRRRVGESSLHSALHARAQAKPPDPIGDSFEKFLGSDRPPPKKKAGVPPKRRASAREQVLEIAGCGEWHRASPVHFVALYAVLYAKVYGIESGELEQSQQFAYAASAAKRCLKDCFADDKEKFADFIRWTWKRETDREKWRRENGNGGGRLGWGYAFSKKLVDEYRLDRVRMNHKRRMEPAK